VWKLPAFIDEPELRVENLLGFSPVIVDVLHRAKHSPAQFSVHSAVRARGSAEDCYGIVIVVVFEYSPKLFVAS
jgi:hypothetical protein